MMPYYYVDDDLNKAKGIDDNFEWPVINYLYEPVDNNKDWVIIVFFLIHQDW